VARSYLVEVTMGDGWTLWWPRHQWEALTAEERKDVISRQRELLEGDTSRQKKTVLRGEVWQERLSIPN
jgi:hypothetical protein